MHMGLLGLKDFIEVPKNPTDDQIRAVINNTHAQVSLVFFLFYLILFPILTSIQGGFTVVNHIPWSYWASLDMPSSDELIEWGVDFFDVTTYERLDLQTIYYAQSKGVGIVAGTDNHERMSFAMFSTLIYHVILSWGGPCMDLTIRRQLYRRLYNGRITNKKHVFCIFVVLVPFSSFDLY